MRRNIQNMYLHLKKGKLLKISHRRTEQFCYDFVLM